jgi:hypothetical protein
VWNWRLKDGVMPPRAADAWVDETGIRTGYEISFSR